ncbi:Mitogen-activated protein kinase kinase kinase [Parasponia andersonii]|uniref:RING-type E3 ubiquitin transferase n=1 Tax=Parasponia andersonii TaxID=3476 RepID=A0A2P5BQH1_PARAD|nr:Mitogen-activated protein kinase kinase kinase [Parasponia andersonii]
MDRREVVEEDDKFSLPTPSGRLTVGIAINGHRRSKNIVLWALDKFVPEGNISVKLIHVHPRIVAVPTAMGNLLPLSQVREDVAAVYRKEMEWQKNELLLPYRKICLQRKVEVDIVMIESDDVPSAIASQVAKLAISKLVIGAPSRGMFTRKPKGLSTKISARTPNFCTVYAVSKGKLSSIRPPNLETVRSVSDDNCDASSIITNSSYASSSQTDIGSATSSSNYRSSSLTMQRFQALTTMNQTLIRTKKDSFDSYSSRYQFSNLEEGKDDMGSCSITSDAEHALSYISSSASMENDNHSCTSDQASTSDVVTDCSSSESQVNINFEIEKLRIELRHVKGMYAMAQSETNDASQKKSIRPGLLRKINKLISFDQLKYLNKNLSDNAKKLEETIVGEEKAKELARKEKEKHEAAKREVQYVRQCAEREASLKKDAEMKATHDSKEREKLETALVGPVQQYQKFTWEEIELATCSFSEDLKIGMGGYGTVYKCSFHQTTAAVKVLCSNESHKSRQFQQELDILSKIRHPHLLLLIGVCVDHGCLIYEYMENGSLEDRLMQKNGTPPILWFERFRIAWEVASALAFLHKSKPKPIIHRDLKPANILLDHNLVSKIGDVGLAALFQSDRSSMSTMYRDTEPVGTLCYIDPEYQRTGLISPKSDVYAFGMVMLQLLTAKPAMALAHVVETAVSEGHLEDILDRKAGNWPIEETKELAELGLCCVELLRKDRPDLQAQVLPALHRLKEVADKSRDSASKVHLPPPPNHFICPILKNVMNDPCVAADGYTYDRKAIETWLESKGTSPMTNLPLSNKNLIPNYTLLSAIMEWKSHNHDFSLF